MKNMNEWNDSERNEIASKLRVIGKTMVSEKSLDPIREFLYNLALAIDNN